MIDDSTNFAFQQCGIDTGGHFGLLVIHHCHAMTTHRPNTAFLTDHELSEQHESVTKPR